jgi:hypothetical protein
VIAAGVAHGLHHVLTESRVHRPELGGVVGVSVVALGEHGHGVGAAVGQSGGVGVALEVCADFDVGWHVEVGVGATEESMAHGVVLRKGTRIEVHLARC